MTQFIYVENQRHDLPSDEVDAAEIRRLGSIPDDNKVYRETPAIEPDPEIRRWQVQGPRGREVLRRSPGTFGCGHDCR